MSPWSTFGGPDFARLAVPVQYPSALCLLQIFSFFSYNFSQTRQGNLFPVLFIFLSFPIRYLNSVRCLL